VARLPSRILAEVRDERRYAGRPKGIIITELQGLESLLASLSRAEPTRPRVLRKLAEGYVELAWRAERDVAAGDQQSAKIVVAARHAAMKYYQRILTEHPEGCAPPDAADPARSAGCHDEVLYAFGLEAERLDELDTARKAYLELIQRFPGSRYVAGAYLAFAELFAEEAQSDPSKVYLAEESYRQVLERRPPGDRMYDYAHARFLEVRAKSAPASPPGQQGP
jgi:hypothetical protein